MKESSSGLSISTFSESFHHCWTNRRKSFSFSPHIRPNGQSKKRREPMWFNSLHHRENDSNMLNVSTIFNYFVTAGFCQICICSLHGLFCTPCRKTKHWVFTSKANDTLKIMLMHNAILEPKLFYKTIFTRIVLPYLRQSLISLRSQISSDLTQLCQTLDGSMAG